MSYRVLTRNIHRSPVVEADLVPDHGHELDGGVWWEAVLPVLPLRPGTRVPHAPPGVKVLRLGYGQVVIPPAIIMKIFLLLS